MPANSFEDNRGATILNQIIWTKFSDHGDMLRNIE